MSRSELEELAAGPIHRKTWLRAWTLLDRMAPAEQADAVAAWEAATVHWGDRPWLWAESTADGPFELRNSRKDWSREVYSGQHQPKHNTIRILDSVHMERGMRLDRILSEEVQLQNLRQLDLSNARIAAAFFKRLRGEGPWQQWQKLKLCSCVLKKAPLQALARAQLSDLQALNLNSCRLEAAGLRLLKSLPHFSSLEGIELSTNHLGSDGFAALQEADWFGQLRFLGLDYNRLSDADLQHFGSERLENLSLEGNTIGQDMSWLLRLPSLRRLMMRTCPVTDDALIPVLQSPDCPPLEILRLYKSQVSDATAEVIATSGLRLKKLALSDTRVTAAGWTRLLSSPALQEVTYLSVRDTGFGASHARQILDGACPKLTRIFGGEDDVRDILKADPRWAN